MDGLLLLGSRFVAFAVRPFVPTNTKSLSRFFLQRFTPGARVLTDKETKAFLCAADDDGDGQIGVDGEWFLIDA